MRPEHSGDLAITVFGDFRIHEVRLGRMGEVLVCSRINWEVDDVLLALTSL